MTSKKQFWLSFFIILALAMITRLIFLDLRPLHHDEGNNYFFTQQIFETGKYIYNPLNYHGPLYFFAIFISFLALGISEFSLRLPAAIFGILAILTPFVFIKGNNKKWIFPSLFLIASPSFMYYSRYSIHESALVLFSIFLVIITTRFLEEKKLVYLPYIGLATALIFATKETGILSIAIVFFICILNFKNLRRMEWKKNYIMILGAVYAFLILYIAFFTWFFMDIHGIVRSFEAYVPWMQRSVSETGHIKPFYYYIKLITLYEAPLLVISLCGLAMYFFTKTKNAYIKNFSIYTILLLLLYNFIPYKMPWIVINITAPLCIIAGLIIENISNKKIRASLGALSIITLLGFSVYLNFMRPWQEDNLYAYVHTYASAISMVKEINSIYTNDSKILIASKEYWPLPFYFHKKAVQYQNDVTSLRIQDYPDFNIFIIQDDIFTKSEFPEGYFSKKYELRSGATLYLVAKKTFENVEKN
ncbi:MAG: hypothetical protein US74_C0006G0012 [Parcubacteria group bacterium GW2011_GWA2_38_13]|nr:MAG: hypothetical protein US74_C0006G0012 [Parcubacteria group bacterium GW2011_GWA2_38_13]